MLISRFCYCYLGPQLSKYPFKDLVFFALLNEVWYYQLSGYRFYEFILNESILLVSVHIKPNEKSVQPVSLLLFSSFCKRTRTNCSFDYLLLSLYKLRCLTSLNFSCNCYEKSKNYYFNPFEMYKNLILWLKNSRWEFVTLPWAQTKPSHTLSQPILNAKYCI